MSVPFLVHSLLVYLGGILVVLVVVTCVKTKSTRILKAKPGV